MIIWLIVCKQNKRKENKSDYKFMNIKVEFTYQCEIQKEKKKIYVFFHVVCLSQTARGFKVLHKIPGCFQGLNSQK